MCRLRSQRLSASTVAVSGIANKGSPVTVHVVPQHDNNLIWIRDDNFPTGKSFDCGWDNLALKGRHDSQQRTNGNNSRGSCSEYQRRSIPIGRRRQRRRSRDRAVVEEEQVNLLDYRTLRFPSIE